MGAYEWQYAAQGTDRRQCPWGSEAPCNDQAPPQVRYAHNGDPVPPPVGSYPSDASPFGIHEMVGQLWQYTSELKDERQRRTILKGGSMLHAHDTNGWYFPGGLKSFIWNQDPQEPPWQGPYNMT